MFGRSKQKRPPNIIRGFEAQEPPTPYAYIDGTSGLGIGVSNKAYQRSHTPPFDSYRGRQGIQVKRILNTLEGGVFINRPGVRISSPIAVNVPTYGTDLVPLFNPKKGK